MPRDYPLEGFLYEPNTPPDLSTLYIALAGTVCFGVISFFGLTVPKMLRTLRRWLVGSIRPAVPAWRRRRLA